MFPTEFVYKTVPVREDVPTGNLCKHFKEVNNFIRKAIKEKKQHSIEQGEEKGGEKNRVLVHCPTGNNAAPCFVAAYLVRYNRFSVAKALKIIRKVRQFAKPTSLFLQ